MIARRRPGSAACNWAPHWSSSPAPMRIREPCSSSAATILPGHFAGTRAPVGDAGEDEQQIGETVEIDDHDLRHFVGALEANDRALGAAADGARDVRSEERRVGKECRSRW